MLRIRENHEIRLILNNPEIKRYSVNIYNPDGEEGLDSAKIYWLKKGSQPDTKNDSGFG